MAIVINGSGTVTGLAVGGLPDGTVDDGTVASGIASSKLTGALPAISGASLTGFIDAQMPAGSVLQVVQATYATQVINNSTSYADTGLSASITPSSTSSKILVLVDQNTRISSAGHWLGFQIVRGSTEIKSTTYMTTSDSGSVNQQSAYNYLDSPNTTNATTYKTRFKASSGTNVKVNDNSAIGTITLMEIAG